MIGMAKSPKRPKRPAANPWPALLRAFREANGDLSKVDAAKAADVPYRTWINWESGHQQPSRYAAQMLKSKFPKHF